MTRDDSSTGLTLAELLVAMGVTVAILGALMALVAPATSAFRIEPERQDLNQRLRVAIEALERELLSAGAGMSVGAASGPLHRYVAPLRPYRIGERRPDPAAGVFYRPDVLSVLHLPELAAQAEVRGLTILGATVSVEAAPNCGAAIHDRLCGFGVGTRVMVFDRGGRFALGTVAGVEGSVVLVEGMAVSHGLGLAGGTAIAEVDVHVFAVTPDATTGVPRLVRYDGFRSESPIVDHVVDLRFEYFGEPFPPVHAPGDSVRAFTTTYAPEPPPLDHDHLQDTWGPGENCVFAVVESVHVSRMAALGVGPGLVPLDPAQLVDGPWCPDEHHPDRFDADLLRIRRVRATVRVEAGSTALRGNAGPLFVRPGSAVASNHTLPDVEVTLDVAPWTLR